MKIIKILLSCVLLLVLSKGHSQQTKLAIADKNYDRFAYIDAIATYEKVAAKGYKDEKMFKRLGDSYYFNADLVKAEKWYKVLFEMNPNQDAEYLYRYAQSLRSIENYKKADEILELFYKKAGNDQRAKLYSNNKDYLQKIKENSNRYSVEDAGINSEFYDYGSAFWNNNLIFTSSRSGSGVFVKKSEWTNQSFDNMFSAELDAMSYPKKVEVLSSKINSKFNDATPVFTKDGLTMYFTRNNYLNGKKGKDDKRIVLLKIYKASFVDGKWTDVKELPFNSDQYNVAHPALSPDEKELYFSSDMPGTLGQSDLYKVTINGDDTYSKPQNLGSAINTEGRETFPFISDDNELFFASNGRPGLGGLDIFVAKIGDSFKDIQNIGAPINSPQDDFAFLINSKTRVGFFTSNRVGGHGFDDIYRFTEIKKPEIKKPDCIQTLNGYVTDKETEQILPDTKVTLYDVNMKSLASIVSDNKGFYTFSVECGNKYFVRAEKMDYESNEGSIDIPNDSGESRLSLLLAKRIKKIGVGTDLAKVLDIPIIYFDLDKSFIRKDAAFELEKVLTVMNDYPKMKVAIRSHTDSRQTFKYNEALSDRRAKSTRAWLIKNGIAADRLTAKGFGEYELTNKCADDVECTEAEHQLNRRSEFIITSMD